MSDKESRAITVTTGSTATTKWVIFIVAAATVAGASGFVAGMQMGANSNAMRSEPGQVFGQMDGAGVAYLAIRWAL